MRIAIVTTDGRELMRRYHEKVPAFGTAPEALLQGFAQIPEIEVHVISCVRRLVVTPGKLHPNIFFHTSVVPKIGWLRTAYQGCIRAVRKKLKAIQPNIVHGQGTERDCAISAVFSGFPNVVTIHGNMAELARLFHARIGSFAWLTGHLEKFTLRRTSGVLCNSIYTEGLVRERTPRTWLVPNPIRESFFSTPLPIRSSHPCILVNVGLISERKRQVELLEMADHLHENGLNFVLQFVGHAHANTSSYAARFLDKIKIAEKAGYARYLGPKSTAELIACFDQASALVHFPSEEAFGLVVAEGLARNLKFFGARLGGISDISAAVPNAELFAMNDWEGLAGAISRWIAAGFPKPADAVNLMQTRYAPQIIARRHLEIYREVLSNFS
ncbi:MAG: glycosyltransferase family 4 protein [Verrucomicrobiota bacterium]